MGLVFLLPSWNWSGTHPLHCSPSLPQSQATHWRCTHLIEGWCSTLKGYSFKGCGKLWRATLFQANYKGRHIQELIRTQLAWHLISPIIHVPKSPQYMNSAIRPFHLLTKIIQRWIAPAVPPPMLCPSPHPLWNGCCRQSSLIHYLLMVWVAPGPMSELAQCWPQLLPPLLPKMQQLWKPLIPCF